MSFRTCVSRILFKWVWIRYLASFQRYCRFSVKTATPRLFHSNFGNVPFERCYDVGVPRSEDPKLIIRCKGLFPVSTTAALRVAIYIKTPTVFLYLSQRAAQHCRLLSQRSEAVVEILFNSFEVLATQPINQSINQSIDWSINQSKHFYIAPCVHCVASDRIRGDKRIWPQITNATDSQTEM